VRCKDIIKKIRGKHSRRYLTNKHICYFTAVRLKVEQIQLVAGTE